jgi:poly(beta-D-mannuronate) lyase
MVRVTAMIMFLALAGVVRSKEYTVSSAAALAALTLQPGDKVYLEEGKWTNQQLVFKGSGTTEKPITLTVRKGGSVTVSGTSQLLVDGRWLVVDGLKFADGYSPKGAVVMFSKTSEHCRLTNTAIIDYNPPQKETNYNWVLLRGMHNRVDHCYFTGKNHVNATLVVEITGKPNYHRIDHNYFGPRPELGQNGGESIRVGYSGLSLTPSHTTVEYNVFKHCNGEGEIITNKSCNNIYRYNLFFESEGALTLRHGNGTKVYGNYFIGNGQPRTGGIRVIGEDQEIYQNYFHGLAGDGARSALSVMNGMLNSPLHGYYQVKNARIRENTFVNCRYTFLFGFGKKETVNEPPVNVLFYGNTLQAAEGATVFMWLEPEADIRFENNTLTGRYKDQAIPDGVRLSENPLAPDADGLYHAPPVEEEHRVVLRGEGIGPHWIPGPGKLVYKDGRYEL